MSEHLHLKRSVQRTLKPNQPVTESESALLMSGNGSLRKSFSVGEDLLTRSFERNLEVGTAIRSKCKLPPLMANEKAVMLSKHKLRAKFCHCIKLVRLLARIQMWLKSHARYDGYSELLKEVSHHYSPVEFTVNQTLAFSKAAFFAHNTI